MVRLLLLALVLALVSFSEGAPPKSQKVKCKDKSFTACYKQDLYCPESCPKSCIVDCNSCQALCVPRPKPKLVKCRDKRYRDTCTKDIYCPASCPKTCIADCASCQPLCPIYPPPTPTLSPPPPVVTPSPAPPPAVTPSPGPPSGGTPSAPPPDSSEAAAGKRVRCKNKSFPSCYYREHRCPAACPDRCEVDCVTCSPVCGEFLTHNFSLSYICTRFLSLCCSLCTDCNKPGALCQDPRFIGADGITFYFHGKKDADFCIVSDANLHINAHFIGRRSPTMGRDFTWVQSLGILFNRHRISVAAEKTATWDDAADRLSLSFDGAPVLLPEHQGAKWESESAPGVSITRSRDANAVVIEVAGNFRIRAAAVPITEEDSRVHGYGIVAGEDCFAHLDLGFKFYSLSGEVDGVLGQTYGGGYVSRVKMGVDMPVLGGEREFGSSGIFSTDCAVARFNGTQPSSSDGFQYANMQCSGGLDGRGVVCKR